MRQRRTTARRPLLRSALVLTVTGVLVAACGGGGGPTTGGGPSDQLTIALPTAVQCLDPLCGGGKQEQALRSQVYLSLTEINPDLELVGQAAESWDNPSPTEWVFHLHDGITFESGGKLDAAQVKANFDRYLAPENASSNSNADLRRGVKSVAVVDPLTVRFDLNNPWTEFAQRLSTVTYLDTAWLRTGANATLTASADGPYRVVSFNPESEIVLETNPSYFGTKPAYGKVTYRVLPSASARLSAIQSGEADVVTGIDPQDMNVVESDSNLATGAVESTRSMYMWFNTSRAPFDKQEVRQALNYAVDKKAIIDSVMSGLTQPLQGQVLSKAYTGFDPNVAEYPFDQAKAKALLAQAGVPNGFDMTLSVPQGAYVGVDLIAQALAGQLGRIGVNVKVESMPFAAWQQTLMNGPEKAMDATLTGFASPDNENLQMLSYFASDYIMNHSDDPGFDAAYDKVRSATTNDQLVAATQAAMAQQHDWAQLLFLFPAPLTYAVNKSVDITIRPDEWLRANDAKPATAS